jgi:hypothetical protein
MPDLYLVVLSNVYHGTKSFDNAINILNYGWKPGTGSAYGTGIYFGDWDTAKSYAGNSGYLIEASIRLNKFEIVDYKSIQRSPNCPKNGDGLTACALSRGFRVLKVNSSMYVVLAQRESIPSYIPGVVIKGVYSPITGQKIIWKEEKSHV